MKAITVWQPWASAIALGLKRFETRGWATAYRGLIAIHAAARRRNEMEWAAMAEIEAVTRGVGDADAERLLARLTPATALPRGAVIAFGELVAVHHAGTKRDNITHLEEALGDWSDGRYAWELVGVQQMPNPVPAVGKQGLWEWEQADSLIIPPVEALV